MFFKLHVTYCSYYLVYSIALHTGRMVINTKYVTVKTNLFLLRGMAFCK